MGVAQLVSALLLLVVLELFAGVTRADNNPAWIVMTTAGVLPLVCVAGTGATLLFVRRVCSDRAISVPSARRLRTTLRGWMIAAACTTGLNVVAELLVTVTTVHPDSAAFPLMSILFSVVSFFIAFTGYTVGSQAYRATTNPPLMRFR